MVNQTRTEHSFYKIYGSSFESIPTSIIVLLISVMGTVLITSGMRARFNCNIPRKLPVLLISITFGLLANSIPHLNALRLPHSGYPPSRLLNYYIPAFCLRTIHKFKKPSFHRYFLIYLVLSFVPLLSQVVYGFTVFSGYRSEMTLTDAMLFAAVFSIEPFFIMSVMCGLDKFKLAHTLLQGEALFAPIWSFLTQNLLYLHSIENVSVVNLLFFVVKSLSGAVTLGYIFAKSMTIPLSYLKCDANVTAGIMLGTMVLAYCIADLLQFQAYLTCLTVALITNHDKHLFDIDNEEGTSGILKVLYTITDLVIYSYCILKLTVDLLKKKGYTEYIHVHFFNYCSIMISRLLSYSMAYPLIKKMLPSFVFADVTVISISNDVGNIPLILNVIFLNTSLTHHLATRITPFLLSDVLLTAIFNNPGMAALMRLLQYNTITAARIASVGQCLKVIANEREKLINTVKLKRYMADVNWRFVRKVTSYKLPHPYPKVQDDNPAVSEVRTTTICCENCPMMPEFSAGNRPKFVQYTRNAKKRLAQEIMLIAKGHYEKRLISKKCLTALEKILDKDHPHQNGMTINYVMLKKYFKYSRAIELLTKCYRKIFEVKMANSHIVPPRAWWRRPFYYILQNLYFRLFISLCILISIADTMYGLFHMHLTDLKDFVLDVFILMVYIAEFVITIIAYSWISWSDGFQSYFSSHWHILDFISMVVTAVAVVRDFVKLQTGNDFMYLSKTGTGILTVLQMLRALRIFQALSVAFPTIINNMQKSENERLTLGFELSKELVDCINEILLVADRFVENKEVRECLFESLREARMEIYKLLIETKCKKSWIATTTETKQLINATKYVMRDALQFLKVSGFVDTSEYLEMIKSITKNDRIVHSMVKISTLTTDLKFSNVWWLENDANLLAYLQKRAVMENVPAGEIITHQGDRTEGIYVIILGVVEIKYEPSDYIINRLTQDGYLPLVDNVTTTMFEDPMQVYIMPGNSMGELGFLTGRCSDCDITSLTDVKMNLIRREDLEQYMKENKNIVEDLQSRLWKYATAKLAAAILRSTTTHQSYTIYDINLKLERSMVPNLTGYAYFVVTEEMEDIILLEGLVVDYYTRDVFIAPCYIPRTVLKLEIPKYSFINKLERLQTQLMIIPTKSTDTWSMMEQVEELANVPPENRKYMRLNKKKRKSSDARRASKISQSSFIVP